MVDKKVCHRKVEPGGGSFAKTKTPLGEFLF